MADSRQARPDNEAIADEGDGPDLWDSSGGFLAPELVTAGLSAEPVANEMTRLRADRSAVATRTVWTLADQALSSLTNFGIGIVIASRVSPSEFGAFAIAFSVYVLALGISRALATEPLTVRASAVSREAGRDAIRSATGLVVGLGFAAGSFVALTGLMLGGTLGSCLIAMAAFAPGLLLQDAWRFAFFSQGRPAAAAANDFVWLVAQVALLGVVLTSGKESVSILVACWGLAGTTAAGVGIAQARLAPQLAAAVGWLRMHRDLNLRFALEFTVIVAASDLLTVLLGSISGLAAAGELQAGQMLLGPINVILISAGLIGVPELARQIARKKRGLLRFSAILSIGAVALTATWIALVEVIPDDLGQELFGASWSGAQRVLPVLAIWAIASAATVGASSGLRAQAKARTTLRLRALVAAVALGAGVPLIAIAGAIGAGIALASAAALALPLWWASLSRASHSTQAGYSDEP